VRGVYASNFGAVSWLNLCCMF